MEGFLLTLKVTTGTSGGYQLGGKITPTAVWPTNKAWTIVWVPNGIMAATRIPQLMVFAISHPTSLPILPSPFVSYTDIKKEWQNTMKFSHQ